MLLARSADAATVQDRVERDWSSIHDVTGSEVLVITPVSEKNNVACVEKGGHATYGRGLTFRTALQQHWRKSFESGDYQPNAPEDNSWRKESTHAVTDILYYFRLPERVTPCLLILVFWDDDAYLVRVDDSFNPYSFFQDIALCGDADVIHSIRDLSQQIMKLDDRIAAENSRMRKTEHRMRSLSLRLAEVGTALPEHSNATAKLAAALSGENPMTAAELADLIEQFSTTVRKAAQDGRIPKNLADNLPKSLRAATVDLTLTFPAHEEKARLLAKLHEEQGRRRMGEAVAHAARRHGLEESESVAMQWPGRWRQAHMFDRRNRAASLIYAGISSSGNQSG
jgi:hypothetical protein